MSTYTFKVLHDKGTHFVSIYAESGETALKEARKTFNAFIKLAETF